MCGSPAPKVSAHLAVSAFGSSVRAVRLGQVAEHPLREFLPVIDGNAGIDHALEE